MDLLDSITELSHEFGTIDYVRGGGGNTSVKNETTLWVKPSGTTLATLKPESFVAINRAKLSELYMIEPPADSAAREALVKEKMGNAVLAETTGRASVEAPLHDSLSARFVVHTHPAAVNGMTCAKNGAKVCRQLFPSALWLDYIDPGYTLCMQVRREIHLYQEKNGQEPAMIFLKNHGVFIAADTPDEIRRLYTEILDQLKGEYDTAGISQELEIAPLPNEETLNAAKQAIRSAMPEGELYIEACGAFDPAPGPISPDHIVYSKSYPFMDIPTPGGISAFRQKHGYLPQVMVFSGAVFGVAGTQKKAVLALELAQDGALVKKLADAFGGIEYMTDRAREFIENWEVESYRSKQL